MLLQEPTIALYDKKIFVFTHEKIDISVLVAMMSSIAVLFVSQGQVSAIFIHVSSSLMHFLCILKGQVGHGRR